MSLAVTIVAICWIKLNQEEALMIKHFKGKYIDYKKRTKALIPYAI
jgi:protein-S-isoprenylcysteine O-methyltransferase Ste14